MHPKYNSQTREWEMVVPLNETEVREKLESIPGLRFTFSTNTVRGMIDAVVAACGVLGVDCPDPGPPEVRRLRPHNFPLKDYQIHGVMSLINIISKVGGALLADDMGLGKTLQTICLANQLPQPSRNLVVAPRFMSEGWGEELTKWGERDFVMIRSGKTRAHQTAWVDACYSKWVVVSYEMLPDVAERCFNSQPPDFLIFDEAHMVKGRRAGRSKVAEEMATLTPFKLAITATPMWSRPRDFYQILKVLLGKRFGSPSAFDMRYCNGTLNAHGGMDNKGATNSEELKRRLACYMVRREKKDVLKELPSLTRQVVWLPPDAEAERALRAAVLNKRANATYAAVHSTAKAKMDAAIELARQAKQFVLFTYERAHVEEIASRLDKGGTPNVWIHGGIPVEARFKRIALAKANKWGIVANIDSLGAGVNLQGVASVGIMHVLDWVPLKMAQAEARIHRMGQEYPVMWYYLACKESMDEIVVRNVIEKLDQWRSIVGQDSNRSMRDALGDSTGTEASEAEALRLIYEAM